MMDDPFACFGDSDGESECDEPQAQNDADFEKREILLEQANKRITLNNNNTNNNSTLESSHVSATGLVSNQSPLDETSENHKLPELPSSVEVPFSPALYMGPMRVVKSDDIGGNRGYIATEDLQPGTLLLVENPIFEWSDEQIGSELGLVSIQAIFRHEKCNNIINDIRGLYPTKDQVDDIIRCAKSGKNASASLLSQDDKIQIKDMFEVLEMIHSGEPMERTLDIAKMNGFQEVDEIDVYRMLLAMRYNGFGSGIYLHFAMFNHDNDANCIKFVPEKTQASSDHWSEVRTTKFVKRGDPLTLDYLNPREQSHATRRWHLWDQHRFDIGELSCNDNATEKSNLKEMDLVNKQSPKSCRNTLDRSANTYHVECALKELEEQQREIKIAWSLMKYLKEEGEDVLKLFEHSKAMGEATLEAIGATEKKLNNDCHLLLIRCRRLYLDVAETTLEMGGRLSHHFSSSSFGPIGGYRIMTNFVITCHKLLPLQIKYLGSEHPDIATTNSDLANMINSMISHCPRELYNSHECYSSFGKCQLMEAKYLKEFRRLQAMYPKDAGEKVKENVFSRN